MESSLLTQYKGYELKDNNSTFTTDSGVIYTAYFILYNSGLNIYSFSFGKNESDAYVPDFKIKYTIIHLLLSFITKNDGAIIYTCDSCDGKEAYRNKLFRRWFAEYTDETLIIESSEFKCADYHLFSSVILKDCSVLKKEIIDYFNGQCDLIMGNP